VPSLHAPIPDAPSRLVKVEVDVTKVTTTPSSYGVLCGSEQTPFPYGAVIDANGGSWELLELRESPAAIRKLRVGTGHPAIRESGTNRISLACVEQDGSAALTFTVNGSVVAKSLERMGGSGGPGPGLQVIGSDQPTEVSFDNFILTYA
jgi:hypothetical protein